MNDGKTAYLGLGGNVGDVIGSMAGAFRLLDDHQQIKVEAVSSVFRTPPWGVEDQDWFHNACAEIVTTLNPQELLEQCLETERAFKRERRVRWGPRTLDIDILIYEGSNLESENLTLPHPRMQERAFVMAPLGEIAPQLVIEEKTPAEWLAGLQPETMEKLSLDDNWWR